MAAPFERIIALDFETTWGRGIKLGFSAQTNEEYIRDPRFRAWGLAYDFVDLNEKPWQQGDKVINHAVWLDEKRTAEWIKNVDWSTTAIVCQNTQFDGTILSWKYGVQPAFMFDTLSMGRALFGVDAGNSLKMLAQRFNLPPKMDGLSPTENVLDERLSYEVEKELATYCKHDTWLCKQLFLRMVRGFPTKELKLIDMTLKMYTQPRLLLDKDMLADALLEEKEKREGLLKKLNVEESQLASNPQFADLLRGMGVEPPMKKSKTTGEQTLALAKNDAKFQALMNSDNEDVALLCEARLKVKSTTERTRAQRFLDIANRGALPVPLTYFGAVTGRYTACLVADTEVLVYDRHNGQCLKRIVDVLPDDLVWDGVEFVQHEGVQFSGYQEVMTYGGLTGTAEHQVFLDESTSCTLAEAAKQRAKIVDAAKPDSGAVDAARGRLKRLRW